MKVVVGLRAPHLVERLESYVVWEKGTRGGGEKATWKKGRKCEKHFRNVIRLKRVSGISMNGQASIEWLRLHFVSLFEMLA